MPKASLVSVVEDDQFFRESMRRLMRSLGYRVETFPSAADFLASPLLGRNRLLDRRRQYARDDRIGAPQAPHRSGVCDSDDPRDGLSRMNDVRARALNDGVVCYLRKPVDEKHLMRCLREALHSGELPEENS